MIYAFTFIGEFGYELFNWQGVIRKWAKNHKNPNDKVYIFSRHGLESWYEFADKYFDISTLESYNRTVADCYTGYIWEESNLPFDDWPIIRKGKHIDDIKKDIKNLIKVEDKNIKWVFSCDYEVIDGYHFGHGGPGGGGIYTGRLNLNNNEYKQIPINTNLKSTLQKNINIDLDKPYILCQTGFRDGKGYTSKSKVKIDHKIILDKINFNHPILFLNFNSGRYWDSTSNFNKTIQSYECNNFNEQAYLIKKSKHCIFTTEGDFRSHLYLPPMLGKDVHIIASHEVLNLPSSSTTFWNENVFNFGGKMYSYEYENFNNIKI